MRIHDATETAYRNGLAAGKPRWKSIKTNPLRDLPGDMEIIITDGCSKRFCLISSVCTDSIGVSRVWFVNGPGMVVTHWMETPELPEA